MAKKVFFKLDINGLRELMKSSEMQAALDEAGAAVASAAGEGYGYRTHVANYVAITNVFPETKEAAHDNYESNALEKALGSTGLPRTKKRK